MIQEQKTKGKDFVTHAMYLCLFVVVIFKLINQITE